MLVGGESLVNYLTCDSLSSFYGLGVRDFKPLSVSYWFALDLCPRKALVSSYRAYIGLLEIGKIIRSSWRHTFSLKRLTSNFCCDTQCSSTALLSATDSSPCHSCVLFFIIGALLPCVICPCFGGIKLCPASWSERWPRVLGNPLCTSACSGLSCSSRSPTQSAPSESWSTHCRGYDLSFLRVSLHFSAPLPHQWIPHDFVQMPMFIFSSFWRAERGDPAPVVAPGISHLYNSISFRGINLGGTSLWDHIGLVGDFKSRQCLFQGALTHQQSCFSKALNHKTCSPLSARARGCCLAAKEGESGFLGLKDFSIFLFFFSFLWSIREMTLVVWEQRKKSKCKAEHLICWKAAVFILA